MSSYIQQRVRCNALPLAARSLANSSVDGLLDRLLSGHVGARGERGGGARRMSATPRPMLRQGCAPHLDGLLDGLGLAGAGALDGRLHRLLRLRVAGGGTARAGGRRGGKGWRRRIARRARPPASRTTLLTAVFLAAAFFGFDAAGFCVGRAGAGERGGGGRCRRRRRHKGGAAAALYRCRSTRSLKLRSPPPRLLAPDFLRMIHRLHTAREVTDGKATASLRRSGGYVGDVGGSAAAQTRRAVVHDGTRPSLRRGFFAADKGDGSDVKVGPSSPQCTPERR